MNPRVLMIFVDGLGLGEQDSTINPVVSGCCPALAGWLSAESCVPLDAGLGVPGLPQSATGQTALLTGINAAAAVGRHIEGFPGPGLRAIIEEHNIFRRLLAAGKTATFANAYYVSDMAALSGARLRSVTTIATLSALGCVRGLHDMELGKAVYQDITRALLRHRGYTGPLVHPEEAAGHLFAIARAHDFTLFEYFQTDRAGHTADMAEAKNVLGTLDAFLSGLQRPCGEAGINIVLSSDHGNIEDIRVRSHTASPVPLAVLGPDADAIRAGCKSLLDVTPAILRVFGCG